jgi:hypothetical protein
LSTAVITALAVSNFTTATKKQFNISNNNQINNKHFKTTTTTVKQANLQQQQH